MEKLSRFMARWDEKIQEAASIAEWQKRGISPQKYTALRNSEKLYRRGADLATNPNRHAQLVQKRSSLRFRLLPVIVQKSLCRQAVYEATVDLKKRYLEELFKRLGIVARKRVTCTLLRAKQQRELSSCQSDIKQNSHRRLLRFMPLFIQKSIVNDMALQKEEALWRQQRDELISAVKREEKKRCHQKFTKAPVAEAHSKKKVVREKQNASITTIQQAVFPVCGVASQIEIEYES